MNPQVLLAGDHFLRNDLLSEAVHRELPDLAAATETTLPWPIEPFGTVGEVEEASGSEDDLLGALGDAEACLTQMAPLTRRVLEASPRLRLCCIGRGGPVNANLEAATEHGVAVCFTPGRNAAATAEHTVALVLSTLRRVPQSHVEMLAGRWRSDYYSFDRAPSELAGTGVGVVGAGAVGRRVAEMLRSLGAAVTIYDPHLRDDATADLPVAASLEELLARSQVVTLHARLSAETRGMIGSEQIGRMPTGSLLVNSARGGLVDVEALCDALDAGHLSAAALDVFDPEPIPPGSRLLRTPNLVMTPHLGGASRETARRAAGMLAVELARYVHGERPVNCANPEVFAAHRA